MFTNQKLCGAKTKRGGVCQKFAKMPQGRCPFHGGHARRGIASPTFKHGRYSKDPLARLYAQTQAARDALAARKG